MSDYNIVLYNNEIYDNEKWTECMHVLFILTLLVSHSEYLSYAENHKNDQKISSENL